MNINALKSGKFAWVIAGVAAVTVFCICGLVLTGCGANASNSSKGGNSGAQEVELLSGIHKARVEVEGFDPFTIELDADSAPITVTNFVKLAKDKYYNGLTFYRIQKAFCMQGGTKGNTANGNDKSLQPIKGEFSTNGVDNQLAQDFKRGTVAMARSSKPDSATSTFFITLGNEYVGSLNGNYAAFGTIDEAGMKVVDAIVTKYISYANQQDMGIITNQSEQPIISSITIED